MRLVYRVVATEGKMAHKYGEGRIHQQVSCSKKDVKVCPATAVGVAGVTPPYKKRG